MPGEIYKPGVQQNTGRQRGSRPAPPPDPVQPFQVEGSEYERIQAEREAAMTPEQRAARDEGLARMRATAPQQSTVNTVPYQSQTLSRDLRSGQDAQTLLGADALSSFYGVEKPESSLTEENIAKFTPVVDPNIARSAETDRALALSEDLVDRVLNAPSQAQQLGDQALSDSLAMTRGARGGAGAVQNAQMNAEQNRPAILRDTAQAVIQEQTARAAAAGQAASIYAGVAGGNADRDATIRMANQTAGGNVISNLVAMTGQDYQFASEQRQQIGNLTAEFYRNAQQYAALDVQQQMAQWEALVQTYGIDKTFEAQIRQIAEQNKVGPLEAFKMVLGGVADVASLGIKAKTAGIL